MLLSLRPGRTKVMAPEPLPGNGLSSRSFDPNSALLFFCLAVFVVFLTLVNANSGPHAAEAGESMVMQKIISGEDFPLFHCQPYVGAVRYYLWAPLFAFFGSNLQAFRIVNFLNSALLLLFVYLCCAKFMNRRTALYSIMLLATSINYVWMTKIQGELLTTMLFFFAGLVCFLRYQRTGLMRWLSATAFLFGLGMHQKISFMWYLAGVLAFCAVVGKGQFSYPRRRSLAVTAVVISFLVGYSLTILDNSRRGWPMAKIFSELLSGRRTVEGSVNNQSYISNLSVRLRQFRDMVGGDLYAEAEGMGAAPYPKWFQALITANRWAYLGSIAAVCILLYRYKLFQGGLGLLFICISFLIQVLGAPFTPNELSMHHLVPALVPFPQMMLAFAIFTLSQAGRWGRRASAGVLAIVLCVQTTVSAYYVERLISGGGTDAHYSKAAYPLAEYLLRHGVDRVAVNAWDTEAPLRLISGEKISVSRFDVYQSDRVPFADSLRAGAQFEYFQSLITEWGLPIYLVWSSEQFRNDGRMLRRAAGKSGAALSVIREFENDKGRPIFVLLKMEERENKP